MPEPDTNHAPAKNDTPVKNHAPARKHFLAASHFLDSQRRKSTFALLVIIGIVGLIASVLQLHMNDFIYQRELLWSEPWRWWTAHWVHVGWRHYGLNMLAFLCLPFIFPHSNRVSLLLGLLVLPVLLSAGFYCWLPHLQAYAGLSGILHGIYVLAAIDSLAIRSERKFAFLVLGAIGLKISFEKWLGYSETAQLIQAPVLIEAHQLGVGAGLLVALLQWLMLSVSRKSYYKT